LVKTLSISYNKKYFAVEIEEGKNGGIFIINGTDFLHNAETKMRLFSISRANLIVLPVKNANELTFGNKVYFYIFYFW
jgi:hypothetical protein